jgi:hypothetical protein
VADDAAHSPVSGSEEQGMRRGSVLGREPGRWLCAVGSTDSEANARSPKTPGDAWARHTATIAQLRYQATDRWGPRDSWSARGMEIHDLGCAVGNG